MIDLNKKARKMRRILSDLSDLRKEVKKDIGTKLKFINKALSQEEMSVILKVSQQIVSSNISGKKGPGPETMEKVEKLFRIVKRTQVPDRVGWRLKVLKKISF